MRGQGLGDGVCNSLYASACPLFFSASRTPGIQVQTRFTIYRWWHFLANMVLTDEWGLSTEELLNAVLQSFSKNLRRRWDYSSG